MGTNEGPNPNFGRVVFWLKAYFLRKSIFSVDSASKTAESAWFELKNALKIQKKIAKKDFLSIFSKYGIQMVFECVLDFETLPQAV